VKNNTPALDATSFPALAAFLKGYLHQDFGQEHGSVSAAAAAFCRDASPDERRQLVTELQRLLDVTDVSPARAVARFISRDLGSAWSPRSRRDLAGMLAVLRAHD
jgi:hypothetical protein